MGNFRRTGDEQEGEMPRRAIFAARGVDSRRDDHGGRHLGYR